MNVKDFIFEWRHHLERIKMKKDCDVLEISDDEKIGPFKKGDEVKLPYWQAKILVNQNYAKFIELILIQTSDLSNILNIELKKSQLTPMNPYFYVKFNETMLELTEKNKKNPELLLKETIKNMKTSMRDILSRRFYKLLRMAASIGNVQSEILKNCTNEEKYLFESLRKILKDWESQFLKQK